MSDALVRVKCRCGTKVHMPVALAGWVCDTCLCTKGATDPLRAVGFWHGCLGTPDFNVQENVYWDGYTAALRRVVRTGHAELVAEVTRTVPGIDPSKAVEAYLSQRRGAARRGIGWEFDLITWAKLWADSGKWTERGVGGYVMARKGDAGPYAPENVYIATSSQNHKDAWINKPAAVRRLKPRPKRPDAWRSAGSGAKGFIYKPHNSSLHPYEVRIAGKYIGLYATEAEAKAAYQEAARIHNAEGEQRRLLRLTRA